MRRRAVPVQRPPRRRSRRPATPCPRRVRLAAVYGRLRQCPEWPPSPGCGPHHRSRLGGRADTGNPSRTARVLSGRGRGLPDQHPQCPWRLRSRPRPRPRCRPVAAAHTGTARPFLHRHGARLASARPPRPGLPRHSCRRTAGPRGNPTLISQDAHHCSSSGTRPAPLRTAPASRTLGCSSVSIELVTPRCDENHRLLSWRDLIGDRVRAAGKAHWLPERANSRFVTGSGMLLRALDPMGPPATRRRRYFPPSPNAQLSTHANHAPRH